MPPEADGKKIETPPIGAPPPGGDLSWLSVNGNPQKKAEVNQESIEIPVLLPGIMPEEKKTATYLRTTQTAQNWQTAKDTVARLQTMDMTTDQLVEVGFMDSSEAAKIGPQKVAYAGTGFLISPDGWLVSNSHVQFKGKLTARLPDGRKLQTRAYYSDASSDIAILKLEDPDGKQFPYLKMRFTSEMKPREQVTAVGYSFGQLDLFCSPGKLEQVAQRKKICSDEESSESVANVDPHTKVWQTDCHIDCGSSGSPVLDRKGRVVGVIIAKQQVLGNPTPFASLAVPASEIRRAIQHVPALRKHFSPGGDYR